MPTPRTGDTDVAHWPDPLWVRTPADNGNVRLLRRRLTEWLAGDHLDEDVVDDLVMAASEALENCCDHAFVDREAGVMTLGAHIVDGALVITIVDDGVWQDPPTDPGDRGRGLGMMRALADDVDVRAGPDGTLVALTRHVDRSVSPGGSSR
ncbi:ATP-binding protein [Actinomycetospora sp. C-140]